MAAIERLFEGHRVNDRPPMADGLSNKNQSEQKSIPQSYGWVIDHKALKDPQFAPLLRIGVVPVLGNDKSLNGDRKMWSEYTRQFPGEVVFLYDLKPQTGISIYPILGCFISKDKSEISDDPNRIENGLWMEENLPPNEQRHLIAAQNYLLLIERMKQEGVFPREWSTEVKYKKPKIVYGSGLEVLEASVRARDNKRNKKYPLESRVSNVEELLEKYPEYREAV